MTPHPARFSAAVLVAIKNWLPEAGIVLDPFAGVGTVHTLDRNSIGIEIEPEWARQHPRNVIGNALRLPLRNGSVDCVVTSPVFGNWCSDHHEARDGSKRITYRHCLGRPLSRGSSAGMQWGKKYRHFHLYAWREVKRILRRGGLFILNVSDHIRRGERQHVTTCHKWMIRSFGFVAVGEERVPTPRMRFGRNGEKRVGYESVIIFKRG